MNELANEVQMVINTLNGGLDLPATYKNCATLAACIDKLVIVRDKLTGGESNGNVDSE